MSSSSALLPSFSPSAATSADGESAPDPVAPYDFTQQVGYLLRRAYQHHLALFQKHATDPQLTSIQFSTLCSLRDHGESTQAEIIRHTHIDQATIRGVLDRLKKRNLVLLSADPTDRRKVVASLTAEGRAVLEIMLPAAAEITELTLGDLNPAERVAIVFLLRKMCNPDAK